MKTIYCDVDGVLYNWDAAANHILSRETGKVLTYPSPSWDSLEQEAGPAAWSALWNIYPAEVFSRGPRIVGAQYALMYLSWHYRIVLVTNRPAEMEETTKRWLQQESIPYDELVVCGRHSSKPALLPSPPHFFIDDKPANIEEAKRLWGLRDDQVYLFPSSYNGASTKGWGEILEILL